MSENIVLLHGFGGTHRTFDGVLELLSPTRYLPRALDLPGHGPDCHAAPVTFASCLEHVLSESPPRFTLCGYSMGARIALALALHAPERVSSLVLVSGTAGIEEASERAQRRAADAHLAERLEKEPFEDFIERWNTQPLFAGDPPEVAELATAELRRNRPESLARVLRELGTGSMDPLWSRLVELQMPVSILVGDRDHKFQALGRQMERLLADPAFIQVNGGHRLALENPAALAKTLEFCIERDSQPGE
ncbi:MAG TPA: alpha/beta fold hydrolase [Solirubrobacteraceae bacterium]